MATTAIKTGADDPRICLAVGTGFIRLSAMGMTCVAMSMHKRAEDEDAFALHACSAEEARRIAQDLLEMADMADRENSSRPAAKEGV